MRFPFTSLEHITRHVQARFLYARATCRGTIRRDYRLTTLLTSWMFPQRLQLLGHELADSVHRILVDHRHRRSRGRWLSTIISLADNRKIQIERSRKTSWLAERGAPVWRSARCSRETRSAATVATLEGGWPSPPSRSFSSRRIANDPVGHG